MFSTIQHDHGFEMSEECPCSITVFVVIDNTDDSLGDRPLSPELRLSIQFLLFIFEKLYFHFLVFPFFNFYFIKTLLI